MNLSHLIELHHLARQEADRYPQKRFLYQQLEQNSGRHFLGIIGPRGVGKTILLKQLAREHPDAFYISLDTLEEDDLFDIARTLLETQGIRLLLLDEIHFYPHYARDLKKIYDFLNLKVIFTSSAALTIHQSMYDLSRRVQLLTMFPFSFREYLFFKENLSLPALTFADILEKRWQPEHLRYAHLFEKYLQGGLYPFSLEEQDIFPLLQNILQKVLYRDIPAIEDLRASEIASLEKMVRFIARSAIDGINYTSLSQNIAITRYKAEKFVKLLEKAFILNVVLPTGTNVLKEPKIVMNLPYRLLFTDYREAIGGIREDFFVETMRMKGYRFHYLKSRRGQKTPDYLVETEAGEFILEVGGKGKGREQFKGIDKKKSLIFTHSLSVTGMYRPLLLLGFL